MVGGWPISPGGRARRARASASCCSGRTCAWDTRGWPAGPSDLSSHAEGGESRTISPSFRRWFWTAYEEQTRATSGLTNNLLRQMVKDVARNLGVARTPSLTLPRSTGGGDRRDCAKRDNDVSASLMQRATIADATDWCK